MSNPAAREGRKSARVKRATQHEQSSTLVRELTSAERWPASARALRFAELDITAAQLANQRVATELAIAGYSCELFLAVVPHSKHTLAYGIGALHMGLAFAQH